MFGKSGMMKVVKDIKTDSTTTKEKHLLPYMDSTDPPPNLVNGIGGGIAYDKVTKRIYYNNGTLWLPIASGLPGAAFSYSFIKDGDQTIVSATPSIVTTWTASPSPPYHDDTTSWNLATGVYTATVPISLSLDVSVSWKEGVSNLGERTLRIVYKPAADVAMTAKEVNTQADPDVDIDTTQEASMTLKMETGDQAWIEVEHTAPINLVIKGGIYTSINGTRINSA
jgi:hypothetical protein